MGFDITEMNHEIAPESIETPKTVEDSCTINVWCCQGSESGLAIRIESYLLNIWRFHDELLAKRGCVMDGSNFCHEDRRMFVKVAVRVEKGHVIPKDMHSQSSLRGPKFTSICINRQSGSPDWSPEGETLLENLEASSVGLKWRHFIPIVRGKGECRG
jgi:hypothetical protein